MSHETPFDFGYKRPMHCVECDIRTRWQWKIRGSQTQSVVETYDANSLDASGSLRCHKCASGLRRWRVRATLENYQSKPALPNQSIVKHVSSGNIAKDGLDLSNRRSSYAFILPADDSMVTQRRDDSVLVSPLPVKTSSTYSKVDDLSLFAEL